MSSQTRSSRRRGPSARDGQRRRRPAGRYHSHVGNADAPRKPAAAKPAPRGPEPMPNQHDPVQGVFQSLAPELRAAVSAAGYGAPTPIQEAAIPDLLERRDMVGCAQTGTGKTAAFALPLLQHLHLQGRQPAPGLPQALILAPTRELAAQIGDSIRQYGRYLRIYQTTVFGGVSQHGQVQALRRGVHIVVATPGRLLDLLQQGAVDLARVEVFVLDEADRMLDMGFLPDIRRILGRLPAKRQSLLFSATMPDAIRKLADDIVRNPREIAIAPEAPAVERIGQKVFFVDKENKLPLLTGMLVDGTQQRVLVFAQMKHMANKISQKLSARGIAATAIHGNKTQNARNRALADFKSGTARVLVATDIAARGIDVTGISHVINYDVPMEAETYVHRIGRTARAGADGEAVSFCCAEERDQLRAIERLLRRSVPVEAGHEYHSVAASRATGSQARPPARKPYRQGRRRRP